MANYYSSLYSEAAADNGSYAYKGPFGTKAGEVVALYGTITIDGSLASGDIGYLFPIPAGAKLTKFIPYYTDHGGTCTTDIRCGTTDLKGDLALQTAVALASATALTFAEFSLAWAVNATADSTINLEYETVATPTSGATLTFLAEYVMP